MDTLMLRLLHLVFSSALKFNWSPQKDKMRQMKKEQVRVSLKGHKCIKIKYISY